MEIVTKTVGSDDEEDLVLDSIAFVNPPIRGRCSVGVKLFLELSNIRDTDGSPFLRRVTAIDCESKASSVAFEDHRWNGTIPAINFVHPKMFRVPRGSCIQVGNGQREHIVLVRCCRIESGLRHS